MSAVTGCIPRVVDRQPGDDIGLVALASRGDQLEFRDLGQTLEPVTAVSVGRGMSVGPAPRPDPNAGQRSAGVDVAHHARDRLARLAGMFELRAVDGISAIDWRSVLRERTRHDLHAIELNTGSGDPQHGTPVPADPREVEAAVGDPGRPLPGNSPSAEPRRSTPCSSDPRPQERPDLDTGNRTPLEVDGRPSISTSSRVSRRRTSPVAPARSVQHGPIPRPWRRAGSRRTCPACRRSSAAPLHFRIVIGDGRSNRPSGPDVVRTRGTRVNLIQSVPWKASHSFAPASGRPSGSDAAVDIDRRGGRSRQSGLALGGGSGRPSGGPMTIDRRLGRARSKCGHCTGRDNHRGQDAADQQYVTQ